MQNKNSLLRKGVATVLIASFFAFFWANQAMAAPATPVITTLTQSTSTSPITLTGTADADISVVVTGGVGTSSASTSPSGNWSATVNLAPGVNTLSVSALDLTGSSSAAATVDITYDNTAPAAPVVAAILEFSSTTPVLLLGTAEASSTIRITGGAAIATTTVDGSGQWQAYVSLTPNTVNHLSVTASDTLSNTSTSSTVDITFDTEDPVFATTTDVHSQAGSDGQAVVNYSLPTTTDNFTTNSSVSCSPSSGSLFSGTTTVNCTATDEAGNMATTSFSVIITRDSSGGGSSSGGSGGSIDGRRRVPPGLLVAALNANSNSAVGQVLAGFVIDTNASAPSTGQVLGVSVMRFVRALKTGDRGDDVVALQNLLTELGIYKGPVTGYYGVLTRAAIRRFQANLGLNVTGTLDAQTLNVLNNS